MSTPLIELIDVTKNYYRGKTAVPVLKGISMSIEEGEYTAIMGKSGSGKSTLMNILGMLDRPTSGTYNLLGDCVNGLSDTRRSELRNRYIGFVFQSFNLFPHMSGLDNVETPMLYAGVSKKERRQRAEEMVEKVGLGHRALHKPTELSGGECQRLAIARALTNRPKLLLADEPTGNLDEKTSDAILDIFKELHREGVTILMITHDPEMEERVERTIRISEGLLERSRFAPTVQEDAETIVMDDLSLGGPHAPS